MKPLYIVGAIVASGLALVLFFGVYIAGTYNSEASLKVLYEAKLKDNNSQFDNMWKKIQQSAQVTNEQKSALKDIFTSYATARSSDQEGGSLAKWVQESVPNVDTKTFQNLQNIITSSRDSWTEQQKELIDIARQYNQALQVFPSNIVLHSFGFAAVDPAIVTSARTDKAFSTGKDDDVTLPQ